MDPDPYHTAELPLSLSISCEDERFLAVPDFSFDLFDEALGLLIHELSHVTLPTTDNALNRLAPYKEIVISLILTNDDSVQTLNKKFRGMDKPTNVLSFATLDNTGFVPPVTMPYPLGDVIMGYETLLREATEQQKKPYHHILHLFIHGTLHLLGFDHQHEADAQLMEGLEVDILKRLNISNPYEDPR